MDRNELKMQVCEHFESIQGEGAFVGTPALFVRLQGCNLRCAFCDTKYSWPSDGGTEMTIPEVRKLKSGGAIKHVVVTGGEPLIQPNIGQLLLELAMYFEKVEVETNGTYCGENVRPYLHRVWITCSPKQWQTDGSPKIHPALFDLINAFKVVIGPDIEPYKSCGLSGFDSWYRKHFPHRRAPQVFLMPEGTPPSKENVQLTLDLCMKYGYRYSPRIQYDLGVK